MKRIISYLIFFSVAVFIFYTASTFKLGKIECISQYGPCNKEAVDSLASLEGSSLFLAKGSAKKLLENNFLVESFALQYKIPDILEARVIERKPSFAVDFSDSDFIALVDKDGYVLSFQEATSLPTLYVSGIKFSRGELVGEKIIFSSQIMLGMHVYYKVRRVEIVDDSLYIDLVDGLTAIFPLEGKRDVLLGSFVAIFSKLNAKQDGFRIDNKIRQVDLRYENPVLR